VPQMNFLINFSCIEECFNGIYKNSSNHLSSLRALAWWVARAVYCLVSQPWLVLAWSLRLNRYLPPNWSARVLCL